jgi:hypothetical protein
MGTPPSPFSHASLNVQIGFEAFEMTLLQKNRLVNAVVYMLKNIL